MGPIAALDSVYSKFFDFSGRASRSEYWWFGLFQAFLVVGCIIADVALSDPLRPSVNPLTYLSVWAVIVNFIPGLSVSVRRLHDTGRSGLWYLILIVPFGSIVFLIFTLLPSQQDDNYYGPPPGASRRATYGEQTGGVTGKTKSNPYAAYAHLERSRAAPSEELQAARREQIKEYYRSRVLGSN